MLTRDAPVSPLKGLRSFRSDTDQKAETDEGDFHVRPLPANLSKLATVHCVRIRRMESVLVDLVKAIGAVFSVAFGIYGIGAQTRNEDKTLNRAGRIAASGIILSLVVTLTAQILDDRQNAKKSAEEALRFQGLLNDVFYGPLSTENTNIDMSLLITLDQLRTIDPNYVTRLERADSDRSQCKVQTHKEGVTTERDFKCNGYAITESELMGNELTFDSDSPLAPNSEEPAAELLKRLGVAFVIHPKNETEIQRITAGQPAVFVFGKFWPHTHFSLDGFGLHLGVEQERLPPELLSDANVSSVVDLLGSEIELDTHLRFISGKCVGAKSNSPFCDSASKILNGGPELIEFALKFSASKTVDLQRKHNKRGHHLCSGGEAQWEGSVGRLRLLRGKRISILRTIFLRVS